MISLKIYEIFYLVKEMKSSLKCIFMHMYYLLFKIVLTTYEAIGFHLIGVSKKKNFQLMIG